ncbi:MAG TPA: preprotein translocase subunit SecG [Candidatus Methylacidiphilales bacterium]|jgi:preprotein translocase subunit SecG|nr:preprotein translocase subunit SecG [Candidatus Methylacidiphilales bacterium]
MSTFWLDTVIDFLLAIYVMDLLFMGLVIMMQRSKQEGLGAAFGASPMQDMFGAQTSAVLVKATVYAAALFFILSISLARLYSMREATPAPTSSVQQELEKSLAPTPASTNAAPVTTPATTAPTATTTPVPAPTAGGTSSATPAVAPAKTGTSTH